MTHIGRKRTYGKQKEKKKITPRREKPDRQSSVAFTVAFLKHTLCLIPEKQKMGTSSDKKQ